MRLLRPTAVAAVAVATVALALLVVAATRRHPDEALAGADRAVLALEVAAGVGLAIAGVAVGLLRGAWRPGLLLAAAGPALLLQALPLPDAGGALPLSAALVAGATAASLAGAAVVASFRHGAQRAATLVAGGTVVVSAVWLGALPAATFDPRVAGCNACPRNLALVHGDETLRKRLLESGLAATAVACSALALIVAIRWATSNRAVRRTTAPIQLAAAVALAAAAAAAAYETRLGSPVVDRTTERLWLVECAALGVVGAGVLAELAWARVLSHSIAAIAIRSVPSFAAIRQALSQSAGDPGLTVVFPQGDGTVVDEEGVRAPPPIGNVTVTDVRREGQVVAQIRHDDRFEHAPERLVEAVRAAGLALEHASSRARLRSQLAELTASRARVVEVGDRERQRLERNLHDGAQQRLIALSVALASADAGRPALGRAREELLAALQELRTLAHGIHPASLSDGGIGVALQELQGYAAVPIRLRVGVRQRLPPAVEAAVYRLALDAVRCAERHGDLRSVVVTVEPAGDGIDVAIDLPGVTVRAAAASLAHAFDRVVAIGGEADVARRDDGARIEARLPCAS